MVGCIMLLRVICWLIFTSYINNSKLGWGSATKSNIRTELLDGAKIQGKQYGIPFNKSIEVLTYNKSMFEKYGIKKVPTTMKELAQVSETIYKKSNHQDIGAGYDSLANSYTLGMKNEGINLTDKVNFTGKDSKKVIDYYAQGMKKWLLYNCWFSTLLIRSIC